MAPFEIEQDTRPPARIKVIGVGGGGCNAVDGMIATGLNNVEFHALNSDIQALGRTRCPNKLQIGVEVTHGLGCGGDPMVGEKSALGAKDQIKAILEGADMVFLTTGLGGGTGTGATPVIAQMAKEAGILTVAIVTRPFSFEGPQRMVKAEQGIEKLREYVDTLIVVSNDRLLEVVGSKATLLEAFAVTNNVLAQGVQSISDLIAVPGLINLDFADVRSIMGERGGAVMGVGVGKGENRAEEAVKKACSSPLLDKIEIDGATGVLICITGPQDLKLSEINTATSLVYKAADPNANIIFGAVVDEKLTDEMHVTIIATGFADELRKSVAARKGVEEERLTSPTSSVSLRAKLESMLSRDKSAAPEPNGPAEPPQPPPAPEREMPKPRVQAPPPPRFPDAPRPKMSAMDWAKANAPKAADPGLADQDPIGDRPDRRGGMMDQVDTIAADSDIDFGKIQIDAREEVAGEEPPRRFAAQPESPEAEMETPAYLRRRRDLFE